MSGGETCQSIRTNLNKLDTQGVPSLVEQQTSGKKLGAPQKAKADLYNQLLDKYLGARCHVVALRTARARPRSDRSCRPRCLGMAPGPLLCPA